MKILEKEIDFDFYDADISDNVSEQAKILAKKLKAMENKKKRNILIRETCNAIIDFFEQVLGSENAKLIFGEKKNWNLCFDALDDFWDAQEEADKQQTEILQQRSKKYERYLN